MNKKIMRAVNSLLEKLTVVSLTVLDSTK